MGPLTGIRIIELAGLGPAPFCAMLLADLGADVIRVDRIGSDAELGGLSRLTCRNRRSIGLDLKKPVAVEILLDLAETADVILEGFRPGVAERLGVGPEVCLRRNPRLVYGRMTGWGREGPFRDRAGHDIDYIALVGALEAIGTSQAGPVPPLNLVGDFGGGALYLAMGILAALLERGSSGRGQVVDAAMVDGAASLMTMFYEMAAMGVWDGSRGSNLLDGGAPFYDTYQTADGGYVAVGALEPQFYAELLQKLGLDDGDLPDQYDRSGWPLLRQRIGAAFLARDRGDWTLVFGDSDACVVPVLSMAEAPHHPHNVARGVFIDVGGISQPRPAPRFSRSTADRPRSAPPPGAHTDEVLEELGVDEETLGRLRSDGVVL